MSHTLTRIKAQFDERKNLHLENMNYMAPKIDRDWASQNTLSLIDVLYKTVEEIFNQSESIKQVVMQDADKLISDLKDDITGLKAELAMKEVDRRYNDDATKIIMDCVEAIDWAQTNLKPCEDAHYSDFFNILTNAKDAAEQFLNPPRAVGKN